MSTEQRACNLQEMEADLKADGYLTDSDSTDLIAEVRLLRALLAEAHGVVSDQSLCICDSGVPCRMARALPLPVPSPMIPDLLAEAAKT
jgi:hypothetical protein